MWNNHKLLFLFCVLFFQCKKEREVMVGIKKQKITVDALKLKTVEVDTLK